MTAPQDGSEFIDYTDLPETHTNYYSPNKMDAVIFVRDLLTSFDHDATSLLITITSQGGSEGPYAIHATTNY